MVFVVLRHSQSLWNKENKFTGWNDISLSETGKKEANDAGKLLKYIDFDYVFTSDLARTQETYSILRNYLDFSPEPIITKDLKERDYGDLTGLNKDEIKKEYGSKKLQLWRRSYLESPPNGENLKDVKERAGSYFDSNIFSLINDNKNVLIVSHGNTIRALFVHFGLYNDKNVELLEIPTGVPLVVDLKNKSYSEINTYQLIPNEILDSRGFPTIEVNCVDKRTNKIVGKGECPSGSSCGSHEALELRDSESKRFAGKGVLKAIENINQLNYKLILNDSTIKNSKEIDLQLKNIDSTPNKSILGGNVFTSISFCMMNTAANLEGKEMFKYIADTYDIKNNFKNLPTIMANIINGGKHGQGGLKIQEFMILPDTSFSVKDRVRMICEVYYQLKKLLLQNYGSSSTNIGDEGGFVVCGISTNRDALNIIEESIKKANYTPNKDIYITLDCASSEFYDKKTKLYEIENNLFLTSEQLIEYYGLLIEEFPSIRSIEDPFDEMDYETWKKFTELYGNKINIVGDDLYCTNPELIKQGIENNWTNSLLLKVNQIGTITEAIDGAQIMFSSNGNVVVSHRSGENNQSYLIDIAVAIGAKYVKIGAPCRGERISKYNRLMEIERLL